MIPLACVVICAIAFFYVFHVPESLTYAQETTRASFLRERRDAVYENLRDLNFEDKAGKLPVNDYENMKTSLENEAASILAEIERLESGSTPAPSRNRKGQRL